MIRFAHPEYLYALGLLPLLIALFVLSVYARKRSLRRLGTLSLLRQLMPGEAKYRRTGKFILLMSAFGLAIVGLADPQLGTKMETVKREGVDILIALDVSNSMNAEDFTPSRLENAKRQISLMLDKLENDRIGVVVFAGTSYLQLPLTTDYSAARLFLSAIDTDIVPVQGTAIGSAIRLAMKSFVQSDRKHKVIVVISDGENHEDDAVAAARDAEKDGAIVHTIGMGSPAGAPIPVYQNGARSGFLKDSDGNVVITKLDQAALQEIASAGGGKYILATSSENELDILFKEIGSMEKKEIGARVFTEYEDRFQIPLAAALLLLVIEFFVGERRAEWTSRLKSALLFRTAAFFFCVLILSCSPAFSETGRSLVREGNKQYKDKQFNEAEVQYRKALEKDKKMSQGVFNLGDALYKQGRYQEAAEQFRMAASNAAGATDRAQAYHNLGNSLLKDKKLEDSIQSYKEALKLNPGDLDTKYNLEYAQKMLEQQKQQQQNQNQKQDQKKDQKQDQQSKDQQNKDQQKKDQQEQQQKQDQDKQQQKQDQDQQKQQQDQDQNAQQQKPGKDQQQQQPQQISRNDAERILEALKNEEKSVQKKRQHKIPAGVTVRKNW